MNTEMLIDEKLLKSRESVFEKDWLLWEKKNLNIHRGVIEWSIITPCGSIDEIAGRVREGVKLEFSPGWIRGFGFGTILHLKAAPKDFCRICDHVDTRNKTNGVWQWAIICFDEDRLALGVHTWLKGYLRPVYESILQQAAIQGYACHSVEAEIDPLIRTLTRIGKVCHAIGGIGGLGPRF